ncbi:hypothetical protein JTE90_014539 [Oedothorax gibbosus]|uniref:Uncharacterized protein n=1 Tax=Oedothorax gibbosus TaxID=931172 RepID=A0AAV6TRA9_9ARAC|nr:hypothetical protein JTE90_014539 [Oedothorax gibbosus]
MNNPDTMMYKAVIFAVCASFLFVSGDAGDCRHPAPVEKVRRLRVHGGFIVPNKPGLHRPLPPARGGTGGMHIYNVIKKV